jgi:protein-disulfide isomerase
MANRQQRRRDAQRAAARRVEQQRRSPNRPSGGGFDWRRWGPIIGGVVAVAVIAALVVLLVAGGGDDDDGDGDSLGALDPSIPRDGTLLGDPGAPIQIVEFLDFQCPNCKNYHEETRDPLIEEFVKTGQASIETRHFTIIGQESIEAANAAECAAEQNLFNEYADILFDEQTGENVGDFETGSLKGFAGRLEGMDQAEFDQCLDSHEYETKVTEDSQNARAVGITGTPGFLVGGTVFSGDIGIDGWRSLLLSLQATPEGSETPGEGSPTPVEGGATTEAGTGTATAESTVEVTVGP